MGSYLSVSDELNDECAYDTNQEQLNAKVSIDKLDTLTKYELIDYIKQLKPKNINLTDDFATKTKDMELDNAETIAMAIELYKKLLDTFGEFKTTDQTKSKKRVYFVKPKFDADAVKKSIDAPIASITTQLDTNLIKPTVPIVSMRSDDITITEFNDAFNNVLTKRDMMGISKKILREMPKYMQTRFVNAFNKMVDDLTKVDKVAIGKASYIYKAAKHGPTNDINSFRQLVTIPNIVNHFHRVLCLRMSNYMLANKYIDTNIQKGGVSGQKFAIFEQFYKLKNVLKHANKNNKSCAVLFMDISNAFGNVNLDNLFKILELYNVDKKFIEYVREFYSRLEYYVDTANIKTEAFKWKDGLIQGCSLSPLLFITALNYVLTAVDKDYKDQYGYDLNGTVKILLTAFVDDICIICKDLASVEIVYKRIVDLLKMVGLPINKSKCALMVVNDKTQATGELAEIQKVNTFKYLGEYVSSDGTSTESYIQFIKMVSRKLRLIDNKKISDAEKLKAFNAIVAPWIQRKTMTMYDISMKNRLNIVAIIKPYMQKWGSDGNVTLFSNVNNILNDSTDSIISGVAFDNEDFDADLEKNLDLANYVLKDANVKIEYGQIDDDFQIEMELQDFEELTVD